MKLENIKSEEMVAQYIEGCLNDFEACISTKQETELHIHRLIIYLIKLDRNKRKTEIPDADIFRWLQSKKFQTEQGEQEYKMYFDVDMPKIIKAAIIDFNITE